MAKQILGILAVALVFPSALTTGFGRAAAIFSIWAHYYALIPGLPGDYVRSAYYYLTLDAWPLDSRIQFGSYFAHSGAKSGHGVYIGSYSVLGRVELGERAQIASGVQILSGAQQHGRGADGRLLASEPGHFQPVRIGADTWIGAGAIVMADIGERTTIGAGSVVTKPIPAGVTAVGSPARVLEGRAES